MTRTHGFVSVYVTPERIKVAWTTDWSTFSLLFDIHGEYRRQRLDISSMSKGKRVDVQFLGPELYGTRLTFSHYLLIDSYKI